MESVFVGKCKICGRVITRYQLTCSDLSNPNLAVYHESFGVACLSHKGVKEKFEELVKAACENVVMTPLLKALLGLK